MRELWSAILLYHDSTKDCTRSVEETAEVVAKNWQDLKKPLKPLLKQIKEERQKEEEQTVFIDGIEYLINQVMMAKDSSTKKEVKANNPPSVSSPSAARVTKLTKPAKVPTWTKDLTLEVYVKQPHTWLSTSSTRI